MESLKVGSNGGVVRLDLDRRLKRGLYDFGMTFDAGLMAYRNSDDTQGLSMIVADLIPASPLGPTSAARAIGRRC